jgi:hypothetical protein
MLEELVQLPRSAFVSFPIVLSGQQAHDCVDADGDIAHVEE